MSATAPLRTRAVAAAPVPARQRTRPPLRLVQAPARSVGRIPFVLLVVATLGGGLVALLMLHTLAAQDAFRLHHLQRQAAALDDVEQQLALADQQAAAPSTLAARARALGMVPTGALHVVHRRDGRVVGIATASYVAPAAPAPSATPTATSARPAASPTPSAAPSGKPTATTARHQPAKRAPAGRRSQRSHPH